MPIFRGSTEVDSFYLGSNEVDAIFLGTNEVWSARAAKNSLEFDGSTDHLSMNNTNFGSYTRTKFALAGSFRADAISGGRVIAAKGDATGREWYLSIGNNGSINFDTPVAAFNSASSVITTSTWYSFLVYYDSANGTSGDRIRVWVNNAEIEPTGFYLAPTGAVSTTTDDMLVGCQTNGGTPNSRFDGLIYSFAFFDNVLPSTSDIFDGSAGKVKDVSTISGIKSLLDGVTAVSDFVLATDWTNNGTVTTSSTKP